MRLLFAIWMLLWNSGSISQLQTPTKVRLSTAWYMTYLEAQYCVYIAYGYWASSTYYLALFPGPLYLLGGKEGLVHTVCACINPPPPEILGLPILLWNITYTVRVMNVNYLLYYTVYFNRLLWTLAGVFIKTACVNYFGLSEIPEPVRRRDKKDLAIDVLSSLCKWSSCLEVPVSYFLASIL